MENRRRLMRPIGLTPPVRPCGLPMTRPPRPPQPRSLGPLHRNVENRQCQGSERHEFPRLVVPNLPAVCVFCHVTFRSLRDHVVRVHLPWFIYRESACWSCRSQFGRPSCLARHLRRSACTNEHPPSLETWANWVCLWLTEIMRCLHLQNLTALWNDVARHQDHSDRTTELALPEMLARTLPGFAPQEGELSAAPPNCIAGLLHWRTLLLLLRRLGVRDRQTLLAFDPTRQ